MKRKNKEVDNRLGEMFEDIFNMMTNEIGKDESFEDYMNRPLMTIVVSRKHTNIELSKTNVYEVKKHLPMVIGNLLDMLNEEDRYKAIVKALELSEGKKEGYLYEDTSRKK